MKNTNLRPHRVGYHFQLHSNVCMPHDLLTLHSKMSFETEEAGRRGPTRDPCATGTFRGLEAHGSQTAVLRSVD